MAVTPTIHPDLVDDAEFTPAAATPTAAPEAVSETPPAAEPAAASPSTEPAAETSTPAETTGETPAADQPPAWWDEVKNAPSPKDALRILTKNLPRDEVARDETLAGLIGDLGAKQGKRLFEDYKRQLDEQAARAPIEEAVKNEDLITLGEAKLREERAKQQQIEEMQRAGATYGDVYAAVSNWASTLPADVTGKLAGKTYDGDFKQGLVGYLNDLAEGLATHRAEAEIQKRLPAITQAAEKAALARLNGGQPSPELGTGHPAPGVRVITDEEIAAMDLETYDSYFDEYGRPKNGVQYRATRAVATLQRP